MLCDENGSMSVYMALLIPIFLLILALVVNGHGYLQAVAKADAVAAEAARAAVSAVDTRGATATVDLNDAVNAGRAYLSQARVAGSVTVQDRNKVQVDATVDEPALLPLLITRYHASGHATAVLQIGTRP
ncbi:hypothetical protein D5S17_14770 [Pseudonocardiaceae bacterium YIM PH 21723]|nr:hypothetical protein D5S17_14770 [Pseudonocardiaceae bacterium YIM PH 21723]